MCLNLLKMLAALADLRILCRRSVKLNWDYFCVATDGTLVGLTSQINVSLEKKWADAPSWKSFALASLCSTVFTLVMSWKNILITNAKRASETERIQLCLGENQSKILNSFSVFFFFFTIYLSAVSVQAGLLLNPQQSANKLHTFGSDLLARCNVAPDSLVTQ